MPPLKQSDALLNLSDPNIILGPHKCRATEHLLENGDLLAWKKKKADNASTGMTVSGASTDKDKSDNHTLSSMPPPTHLIHTAPGPRQATSSVEGCDDRASKRAQVIEVEDSGEEESDEGASTEEDNDVELGMRCLILVNFWPSADRLVN